MAEKILVVRTDPHSSQKGYCVLRLSTGLLDTVKKTISFIASCSDHHYKQVLISLENEEAFFLPLETLPKEVVGEDKHKSYAIMEEPVPSESTRKMYEPTLILDSDTAFIREDPFDERAITSRNFYNGIIEILHAL